MRIKYSQDAVNKLREIKQHNGKNVVDCIRNSVSALSEFPKQCPSIENMLGLNNPYYFLHTSGFYLFYKTEHNYIYIVDIYNEREDFMMKMFGLNSRTVESFDFWEE